MKKYLRLIIILIGMLTVISGLMQMVAPAFILKLVGGEITDTTKHFFAIIGMFMFLFGGLIIHALYSIQDNKAAVLWCALQKFGAAIAVAIGIVHHLFSLTAGFVASFDFVSGIIILIYFKSLVAYEIR